MMSSRPLVSRFLMVMVGFAALAGWGVRPAAAKCCVWKVSSPDGRRTLYLAGSVHVLRRSDYPLPAAYEQAFAASSELVFETDPNAGQASWTRRLERAAELPKGTTLKDTLDPRTYAYLQRVLARTKGATAPEKKIEHLRPWALGWLLEAPGGRLSGVAGANGVDSYLHARARKAGKRTSGLVGLGEHIGVFGGMSDADGEVFLLLQFLHLDTASAEFDRTVSAWRRGDIESIETTFRRDYRDAPSLYARLLTDRNRSWLPKVEGYLRGGGTRLVVAGAGHMAGEEGLPALLRARGYVVEQL